METYVGTKLINAEPMTRQTYNDFRGWKLPEGEDGTDEGQLVEYVDGGKPNHDDYEGYISWSPQEVFENAYHKSGEMTFGEAIMCAKRGMNVSRIGWNGAGMYAYIMSGHDEAGLIFRPYWELFTAQQDIAKWSPSGSDSLAEDWCIVED
jgi:hypothetical protein